MKLWQWAVCLGGAGLVWAVMTAVSVALYLLVAKP